MTVERTGLAAGLPLDASTLEAEILSAIARANRENTDADYRVRERQLIGAILQAVAGSALFRERPPQTNDPLEEAIKEASVAISWYLHELDWPFARLEEDILRRLREVPAASDLKKRYHDDRDAECARRRGLVAALLCAASSNTFDSPVRNEIAIDPDDKDQQNRSDLSAALRDFYYDLERLDGGRDATNCLAKAQSRPLDYVEPETNRDTLIWAIVAIEVGAGHSTYRSQAKRCEFVAEYTDCKPSTLGQYLKELRGGSVKAKKFSEQERLIFNERTTRVRSIGAKNGQGLELLLPLLHGRMRTALPKTQSVARIKKTRMVTSSV